MKLTVRENGINYELDIKEVDRAKRKCKAMDLAQVLMTCILIALLYVTTMKVVFIWKEESLSKQLEIIPYILGTAFVVFIDYEIYCSLLREKYIRKIIYTGKYVDIVLKITGIDRLIVMTESRDHVIHEHVVYPTRIIVNGISETYFDLNRMAICSPYKKEGESGNDISRS